MNRIRRISSPLTALAALLALAATACASSDEIILHGAGSSAAPGALETVQPADGLEALVAPIALYPDDLLAVVLPAATHPLQIVQAARLLETLDEEPDSSPDPDWDDAVVALMNYPQVLARLNADLDWTERLGQAVREQEAAVIAAIGEFREAAHAAGHLRSDAHQRVVRRDGTIRIEPTDPAALYVPDYQPAAVRRPSSTVVYRYHSRPYPVYYYPYPPGHALTRHHFWGLTSAFSIGWHTRHLQVHMLSHRAHPYYGHRYAHDYYRYRQPWHARYPFGDAAGSRYHPGNPWHGDRHGDDGRPRHGDQRDDGGNFGRLIREAHDRASEARRAADAGARQHTPSSRERTGGRAQIYRPAEGVRRYDTPTAPADASRGRARTAPAQAAPAEQRRSFRSRHYDPAAQPR